MTLHHTGEKAQTSSGEKAKAKDDNDLTVIISASEEAIEDHGWDKIWTTAESKYDRGEYEVSESVRIVRIKTADC